MGIQNIPRTSGVMFDDQKARIAKSITLHIARRGGACPHNTKTYMKTCRTSMTNDRRMKMVDTRIESLNNSKYEISSASSNAGIVRSRSKMP